MCVAGILSSLVSVGTLLAVFGLLAGRTATVGTCDVFFLFGFGLDFSVVFLVASASTLEYDAASGDDLVYVVHTY